MLEGLTPPPRFTGHCKVATIAESLEAKDKEIFMKAVDDKNTWGVNPLIKALAERGIRISDSPIYNHRGKTCACYRG